MMKRKPFCCWFMAMLTGCLFINFSYAQDKKPTAKWSFDGNHGANPIDSIRGVKAAIGGNYKYVAGVSGDGLRFDGYTTSMTVNSRALSISPKGFTVEAWVALDAYPWNWVPVVDQERQRQEGFFLGIDAFGHAALEASIDGQWRAAVSKTVLPLKQWAHVAGTYDEVQGNATLTIYVNGKREGQLTIAGELTPAHTKILIGRIREAMLPFPEAAVHPDYPVWYSLDGILDELEIYDRSLSSTEISEAYTAANVPSRDVLPWPKMPSGPQGAGEFGAYYTTLHYQDTWDRLRRSGPDSDVVVRFDESPIRLVFWQGTSYVPAWVTENDKWYTDEFLETWGPGCGGGGDCEPMSDKQNRYSQVEILESNNARAVIHWRYAPVEVENYAGAWPDSRTGWFDWTDEYWTVYPDSIAVRKQVLHSTEIGRPHEWQETIVLNQPGSKPEDNINWNAITLENMQGETTTYSWQPKAAGSFTRPNGPAGVTGPANPNMQIVNLKSQWKPFQIVSPDGSKADIYNGENTYFNFECWNHWPVAQIASSGRPCVAADRASHTSLSHLIWKAYSKDSDTETKLLLNGLMTQPETELLPLAKSWISPPNLTVQGDRYRNLGYDRTQRAYLLALAPNSVSSPVRFTLDASQTSPIVDPAFVIEGWGDGGAQLRIDGKRVAWGREVRLGYVHRLQGTDLIVWIQKQSVTPLHLELDPAKR
jgi:Concanavalin A-like lectin/glucanases superfamily